MVKFCPNCGAKLKEGYKFCGKCGKDIPKINPSKQEENIEKQIDKKLEKKDEKIEKDEITETKPEIKTEPISDARYFDKGKKIKTLKWAITMVIILVVIISSIIVYNSGNNPSTTDSNDVSSSADVTDDDGGVTPTDSDGDGYTDSNDAFPYDSSEWKDSDSDGYGDNEDYFPYDSSEWKDSDYDGYGNNEDAFPYDSSEHYDSDNDGVGDNSDAMPYDPDETKDSDNDGIGNNADIDDDNDGYSDTSDYLPFKDAKLKITLNNFKVLDEVDGWPEDSTKAQIYFEIYINDVKVTRTPAEGYIYEVDLETSRTINWDYTYNIPDNLQTHSISIRMFDSDSVFNDQLDIDGHDNTKGCTVTYDIVSESWYGDDTDGITSGSDDGTQQSDDDDAYLQYYITLV